jgi:hypothetical protein
MPAPDLVEARWLPQYAVQRADGTQLEPGDTCLIPPGEARESDHWEILDDPTSRPLEKWPIADLRTLAEEEGADTTGLTSKVALAFAIEQHRADIVQAEHADPVPPDVADDADPSTGDDA